ncbi:hypothetical protein R3P38DRAFT_2803618 [Favolaschia claudopus]|uniref:Uncharacterized protein n=1 Tax=Favolaschia claudopus TaxID=2862362 RepID=A0AAV9ZT24_9AGAR
MSLLSADSRRRLSASNIDAQALRSPPPTPTPSSHFFRFPSCAHVTLTTRRCVVASLKPKDDAADLTASASCAAVSARAPSLPRSPHSRLVHPAAITRQRLLNPPRRNEFSISLIQMRRNNAFNQMKIFFLLFCDALNLGVQIIPSVFNRKTVKFSTVTLVSAPSLKRSHPSRLRGTCARFPGGIRTDPSSLLILPATVENENKASVRCPKKQGNFVRPIPSTSGFQFKYHFKPRTWIGLGAMSGIPGLTSVRDFWLITMRLGSSYQACIRLGTRLSSYARYRWYNSRVSTSKRPKPCFPAVNAQNTSTAPRRSPAASFACRKRRDSRGVNLAHFCASRGAWRRSDDAGAKRSSVYLVDARSAEVTLSALVWCRGGQRPRCGIAGSGLEGNRTAGERGFGGKYDVGVGPTVQRSGRRMRLEVEAGRGRARNGGGGVSKVRKGEGICSRTFIPITLQSRATINIIIKIHVVGFPFNFDPFPFNSRPSNDHLGLSTHRRFQILVQYSGAASETSQSLDILNNIIKMEMPSDGFYSSIIPHCRSLWCWPGNVTRAGHHQYYHFNANYQISKSSIVPNLAAKPLTMLISIRVAL